MVADSRWPMIPLLALRAVQFVLGVISLGLSAWIISQYQSPWFACFALTTALLTIFYAGANVVLYFTDMLLPLAVVCADAFLWVFWLVSVAGSGNGSSDVLKLSSCTFTFYEYFVAFTYTDKHCTNIKAWFAFLVLSFLVAIPSTALAAFVLYQTYNKKPAEAAAASNQSEIGMNTIGSTTEAPPSFPEKTHYAVESYPQQNYQQEGPTTQPHTSAQSPRSEYADVAGEENPHELDSEGKGSGRGL
ncbi:hypothetical protein RUND412_004707 [Rhizina undulata]